MKRIYLFLDNPNGTSDLIITDHNNEVIDSFSEAIFGYPRLKYGGWSGDKTGMISVCYYGESVCGLGPTDESFEKIKMNQFGDVQQVVEVDLDEVLKCISVSPISDGLNFITFLKKHFPKQMKRGA